MALLERYLLRQLLKPFVLGVSVVTFLFAMDFIFDYLDLFLGKGISALIVLKLFFLGLGWILALSIPCGVLVGVLVAYGRLAQDNEVVAIRASGINLLRIFAPAIWASLIVACGLALFNNYVLPDMNHAYANLMLAVNKKRPTAEIQEGVFIDDFDGYVIFIGRLNDRTGEMRDVLIHDFSRDEESARVITARRGELRFNPELATLSLLLEEGELHEAQDSEGPLYHKMEFGRQRFDILGARTVLEETRNRSRGQREMSIQQMKARVEELDGDRQRYEERSMELLGKIGVQSLGQLPGMATEPSWYAPLLARLGAARERPPALPDSFWTPQRRRLAEEGKVAAMQARAAWKRMNQYRVEIQKKLAIPFACIVFALLGAPLGIRARRGGLAAAFLSVGFLLFYYLCLLGGEQLADRGYLAPWISMWLANLVLGILGIWITLHMCDIRLFRARRG
jgi:lipopolysaccharide export system permease protein